MDAYLRAAVARLERLREQLEREATREHLELVGSLLRASRGRRRSSPPALAAAARSLSRAGDGASLGGAVTPSDDGLMERYAIEFLVLRPLKWLVPRMLAAAFFAALLWLNARLARLLYFEDRARRALFLQLGGASALALAYVCLRELLG